MGEMEVAPREPAVSVVVAATSERGRDLVWELLVRSVRLRYRRSILGLLWSQLAPISTIVILSVVFVRVIPLGIDNYPVFVFIGLTSWQWLQGGLTSATTSVVSSRDLVRQPGFPVLLLPPVAVASHLVHYLLAAPVILGAVAVTSGGLPLATVSLPVILLVQFLLCVGPAYILAAAHVRVRDTAEALSVALRLLFYATPIIYDEGRLVGSRFRFLYDVNPVAHLLTAQRDALLRGRWPAPGMLLVIGGIAVALTAIGVRVFESASARFADEV
jgi:lipopolysaccharide transport system permease protein